MELDSVVTNESKLHKSQFQSQQNKTEASIVNRKRPQKEKKQKTQMLSSR